MSSRQMNLLQGTIDLLILKALGPGEPHGLGGLTNYASYLSGQTRILMSGLAPDGRGGLAEFVLGRIGEQSPGKVLPVDENWEAPAWSRERSVVADSPRQWQMR
jgi:hypothetical protein